MIKRSKHGRTDSLSHRRWRNIKDRIYNPNCKVYHNYGGRGLTMFEVWRVNSILFMDYIESLPNFGVAGMTLDRVNNEVGYEPMNLRWANMKTQQRNKRRRRKRRSR